MLSSERPPHTALPEDRLSDEPNPTRSDDRRRKDARRQSACPLTPPTEGQKSAASPRLGVLRRVLEGIPRRPIAGRGSTEAYRPTFCWEPELFEEAFPANFQPAAPLAPDTARGSPNWGGTGVLISGRDLAEHDDQPAYLLSAYGLTEMVFQMAPRPIPAERQQHGAFLSPVRQPTTDRGITIHSEIQIHRGMLRLGWEWHAISSCCVHRPSTAHSARSAAKWQGQDVGLSAVDGRAPKSRGDRERWAPPPFERGAGLPVSGFGIGRGPEKADSSPASSGRPIAMPLWRWQNAENGEGKTGEWNGHCVDAKMEITGGAPMHTSPVIMPSLQGH
jgi:hypothetical protein